VLKSISAEGLAAPRKAESSSGANEDDVDEERRKQLESRLQLLMGELAQLCTDLGVAWDAPAAPPPPTRPSVALEGPLLLARLDDLDLAFHSGDVAELVRLVEITPSLEARKGILGYINLRGQALVVIDLRHLLDLPPCQPDPDHVMVILESKRTRFATVVNEIVDIFDVAPADFQDRHQLDLSRGFLDGVARIQDTLVGVLNPSLVAQVLL